MQEKFFSIEKSFRLIRWVALAVILCITQVSVTAIYFCMRMVREDQRKVYVISDGKVWEALSADRGDNIIAEARDQVFSFHEAFFTLSPDPHLIDEHVNKAFGLSDGSAHEVYQKLAEDGYYRRIISENISQVVHSDSVWIDTRTYPYHFKYFGTLTITRISSTTTRRCWTEGYLRVLSRSENNSHGMLIERWTILDNSDISTVPRGINH